MGLTSEQRFIFWERLSLCWLNMRLTFGVRPTLQGGWNVWGDALGVREVHHFQRGVEAPTCLYEGHEGAISDVPGFGQGIS